MISFYAIHENDLQLVFAIEEIIVYFLKQTSSQSQKKGNFFAL